MVEDWTKLIIAITPLGVAIVGGFVTIYLQINGIHHQMNGMKDELIASTKREARAEGIIEGEAKEQKENVVQAAIDNPCDDSSNS